VGICLSLGWLAAGFFISPACSVDSVKSTRDSSLTVGFGIGGTALAGALQNLVDQLSAEPLIAIGWNGRPLPRLAIEWKSGDDGRRVRLRLRPNVVFHNGTPLTAEIVAAQFGSLLSGAGYGRVERVTADSPTELTFHLKEPDAFLLGELSKVSIKLTKTEIGTGPFVVRTRTPDVQLERFHNYHLGSPAISKVIVRTYETPRSAWAAMMRGDVSVLHELNRDAAEFVEAGSRIQTFSFPRPYYIPIVFNLKHALLGRREVRQAINEAIDRAEIVERALHGRGRPADGPIWPYHWAYDSAVRTYTYNPEAARIRLDAAGFPLRTDVDGMPRRFRLRCLFWSEDPLFERIALVVQRQLFEIGIDMEMVPATLTEIRARHTSGDFDAILIQMASGRSLDWAYWFWRSVPEEGAIARSNYSSADGALDRLRAARSDDETRIAVADLQRVLFEDPPAAFLVRPETARAVDQTFAVPTEERGRDVLGNLWQWKPAPVPPRDGR
jgi:peptide/nickel transport system substrate-binding protein